MASQVPHAARYDGEEEGGRCVDGAAETNCRGIRVLGGVKPQVKRKDQAETERTARCDELRRAVGAPAVRGARCWQKGLIGNDAGNVEAEVRLPDPWRSLLRGRDLSERGNCVVRRFLVVAATFSRTLQRRRVLVLEKPRGHDVLFGCSTRVF